MRVAVVGTSGAGKSTLARQVASALHLNYIELDAINWQAGWRDLNTYDQEGFRNKTAQAVAGEAWVCDGNYGVVRPIVWARATHIVWLDYSRSVVMRRAVWRTLLRLMDRRELWAGTGNREPFSRLFSKEGTIRWAWDSWKGVRTTYEVMTADPANRHLKVLRLRHPREARNVIDRLDQC